MKMMTIWRGKRNDDVTILRENDDESSLTIWREKDQREGAAQARLEGMKFLDQIFLNNFYEK